jgi:hypothetical protein
MSYCAILSSLNFPVPIKLFKSDKLFFGNDIDEIKYDDNIVILVMIDERLDNILLAVFFDIEL